MKLTVKKLIELKKILSIKSVCNLAGVNYYTVKNKTLFYSKAELTEKESEGIQKVLESKGLKLDWD